MLNLFRNRLLLLLTCGLFSLLCLNPAGLQAQRCSATEVHRYHYQTDPDYRNRYDVIQKMDGSQSSVRIASDTTFLIPVVVHILYNKSEQNISDEQVQSQIDVLNEDYSTLNETILDIPAEWQGLIKDAKIRFSLAQRDPDGNFSNGITRTATFKEEFNILDPAIYEDSLGGKNAWPNSQYLNLWVCSLQGNALGFANFPGSSPALDGVVVNYKAFGRIGTASAPYNRGRTSTHEVGHWLNLIHIWGDDNNDCSGKDFPGTQQFFDDTPNQEGPNFRCPSFPKTDNCSPDAPGIMYMNYLDYTDDRCMMFFTPGQIRRMRLITDGVRDTIRSSPGATLPALLANDLAIDSVISPVKLAGARCLEPQIRLRNNSIDTIRQATVLYNVKGGIPKRFLWNGLIAPGDTLTVTLPRIGLSPGSQVMEFRLTASDDNPVNNYRSASCRIESGNSDNCEAGDLLVYPNPVSSGRKVCIRTRSVLSESVTVQVFNSLGQQLFLQQQVLNPGDALEVNLLGQAAGLYFVQAEGETYSSGTKFLYLPDSESKPGSDPVCN